MACAMQPIPDCDSADAGLAYATRNQRWPARALARPRAGAKSCARHQWEHMSVRVEAVVAVQTHPLTAAEVTD
jgi:hypothetical protein